MTATWPETFYGQVAIAHIEPAPQLHLSEPAVDAANPPDVEADALMPEIKVLAA